MVRTRQQPKTYASQQCAWCEGSGKTKVAPGHVASCIVCGGKGHISIAQPAGACAQCEGSGKRNATSPTSRCLTCAGTGWEYQPAQP